MNVANRSPFAGILLLVIATGCAQPLAHEAKMPSVAPATQPAVLFELNGTAVVPKYHDLLAIDLSTVVRVANAHNLDVRRARQQLEANRGRYESNVEAIFPVIATSIAARTPMEPHVAVTPCPTFGWDTPRRSMSCSHR